ncbi:MAG: hypothetical protein WCI29_10305 [Actinomycetes bacterium]
MTATFSVEFEVEPDISIFGEYTEITDSRAVVLLLHDRGADLDSVRAFTHAFHRLLIDTCLVDLPEHGLSGGSWDEHAMTAVSMALDLCSQRASSVGVLAVGAAATVLFELPAPAVHALALIEPALTVPQLDLAESWRSIPQIAMGDPTNEAVQESMENLRLWVRAWSMRVYVHYEADASAATPQWTEHMKHSSAAFIAEQLAYRNLSRVPRDTDVATLADS